MMFTQVLALLFLLGATTAKPHNSKKFCQIHHADVLLQHENNFDEWVDVDHTECNPIGQPHLFYEIKLEYVDLNPATLSGLYLEYDDSWLIENGSILTVPDAAGGDEADDLMFYTADQVLERMSKHDRPDNERSLLQRQFRSLQRTVTDINEGIMIVARVTTADDAPANTVETINDYVFGDSDSSFTNIHAACSLRNKLVKPYLRDMPVLEFAIDTNLDEFTFGSFYAAVEPLIEAYLNVTSIHNVAEFVLLVAPNGLRPSSQQADDFRFVSAGAYNSWKTVVTDDWIDTPQILQHEIGHNYNLGHTWDNGRLYGDSSSVMGQVFRGVVYNCYNGIDYDYMRWMENRTLEMAMAQDSDVEKVELAFYGDFDMPNATSYPFLIKVLPHGFYIYYNRKVGINAESGQHGDAVLVHRYREAGVIQSGTNLAAVLSDDGDAQARSYRNSAFDFGIELCARMDGDGIMVPNTATVAIGPAAAESLCELFSNEPSDFPTGAPTVSPMPSISTQPSISTHPSDVPTEIPSDLPSLTPSVSPMPTLSSMPSVSTLPSVSVEPTTSVVPSDIQSDSPMQELTTSSVPTTMPSVSMVSLRHRRALRSDGDDGSKE